MTHPWKGPRYNTWLSNTVLSGVALLVVFIATIVLDSLNGSEPPPTYLTGLLGVAAGSFFGAVGTDKGKREADVKDAADTAKVDAAAAKSRAAEASLGSLSAEMKADILAEVLAELDPTVREKLPPALIPTHLRGDITPDPEQEGKAP